MARDLSNRHGFIDSEMVVDFSIPLCVLPQITYPVREYRITVRESYLHSFTGSRARICEQWDTFIIYHT